LCALAVGPTGAVQADYSWEVSGRLGQDESEQDVESDQSSLSGTYYFDPVEDGTGPHALAAFFDPATRVSIVASKDKTTSPTGAMLDETTNYSVSGQYLLPRSKWFVGGRYARGDIDDPFSAPTTALSVDLTGHSVVAGKYLGAAGATRIQVALDRSKTDTDQRLTLCIPGCFNGIATADTTTDEIRFDVMHVGPVRAATYALSGGVSDGDSDVVGSIVFVPNPVVPPFPNQSIDLDLGTTRTYFVAGELFPITQLGIRVGFTRIDGENLNSEMREVEASWFFRRNLGLELSVTRQEDGTASTDGAALRVIGRF
jgi:hypothetical protein